MTNCEADVSIKYLPSNSSELYIKYFDNKDQQKDPSMLFPHFRKKRAGEKKVRGKVGVLRNRKEQGRRKRGGEWELRITKKQERGRRKREGGWEHRIIKKQERGRRKCRDKGKEKGEKKEEEEKPALIGFGLAAARILWELLLLLFYAEVIYCDDTSGPGKYSLVPKKISPSMNSQLKALYNVFVTYQ